jgi:hypothetical protein
MDEDIDFDSIIPVWRGLPLFDGIDLSWQRRAIDFHLANPQVMELFLRFARQALNVGAKVGPQAVWERIRWETSVVTTGNAYKVNDAFKSWYSRYAMETTPELAGYFDTRKKQVRQAA